MKTQKTNRIGIVDDNTTFSSILVSHLKENSKYEVAFTAISGEECLRKLELFKIDIILIDLILPGMDGIELTRKINKMKPEILIIGFSGYLTKENTLDLLDAGCCCPLDKSDDFKILIEAIEYVIVDKKYFTTKVQEFILENAAKQASLGTISKGKKLSLTDWQFLDLYYQDMDNQEIAGIMFKSKETVRGYKRTIKKKLGIKSNSEMREYYNKHRKMYSK